MIWLLDPGHGIETPGKRSPSAPRGRIHKAPPPDIVEHEFNFDIAQRVKRRITESVDHEVVITRSDEHTISLSDRRDIAKLKQKLNPAEQCAFISIHANASPNTRARGVRAFTQVGYPPLSKTLAQALCTTVNDVAGFNRKIKVMDRLYTGRPVGVLRGLAMPAVLLEIGFMTNHDDCKILSSEDGRQEISFAMYDAMLRWRRETFGGDDDE